MNVHFTLNITIDDRIIAFARRVFSRKNAVAIIAIAAIAASAAVYAAVTKPHTFTPGAVISSSQVNENFDAAFRELSRIAPVGAIVAWHKSMFNTPALPEGWVECNGQVLIDGDSVYNGQTIPNLNGESSGEFSPGLLRKEQMFLRGGTISGIGQDHLFQTHIHQYKVYDTNSIACGAGCGAGRMINDGQVGYPYESSPGQTPVSGNYGTETRPVNMFVVWIMRVK